jgi:hypothetical protein
MLYFIFKNLVLWYKALKRIQIMLKWFGNHFTQISNNKFVKF